MMTNNWLRLFSYSLRALDRRCIGLVASYTTRCKCFSSEHSRLLLNSP